MPKEWVCPEVPPHKVMALKDVTRPFDRELALDIERKNRRVFNV